MIHPFSLTQRLTLDAPDFSETLEIEAAAHIDHPPIRSLVKVKIAFQNSTKEQGYERFPSNCHWVNWMKIWSRKVKGLLYHMSNMKLLSNQRKIPAICRRGNTFCTQKLHISVYSHINNSLQESGSIWKPISKILHLFASVIGVIYIK